MSDDKTKPNTTPPARPAPAPRVPPPPPAKVDSGTLIKSNKPDLKK